MTGARASGDTQLNDADFNLDPTKPNLEADGEFDDFIT